MLCVFIPITMITGMAGIMFRQLGWIVSIIMIVSTTAALSLVPMLCALLLKKEGKSTRFHEILFKPVNKALDGLSAGYGRMIAWCMRHKRIVLALAVVICYRENLTVEIMKLPAKLKEAALLCWFQGMTYQEAADALNISLQAVGSRLNRARKKLRSAMEGSEDHDPA